MRIGVSADEYGMAHRGNRRMNAVRRRVAMPE
jgi:hypothetical protein